MLVDCREDRDNETMEYDASFGDGRNKSTNRWSYTISKEYEFRKEMTLKITADLVGINRSKQTNRTETAQLPFGEVINGLLENHH